MKIGFIGLGKLGLPVSVAMAMKGYDVHGYDLDVAKRSLYRSGRANLHEPSIDERLKSVLGSKLHIVDNIPDAVKGSDIVFVAVQTPSRANHSFETGHVLDAVANIGRAMRGADGFPVVSVISTVLPGTMRKEIGPTLHEASGRTVGEEVGLCYNASFIAMGTVIEDFLSPEFVLMGESDSKAGGILQDFYDPIVDKKVPRLHMTWENAEIVKMAYNTMIGFKIVFANTLMEVCHKVPTGDVDVVSGALSKANVRIVGAKYLRGGMGDGGPCHPRDNLALSWLSEKMGLSANPFDFVMKARESQAAWLADLLISYNLPIVIMGVRFKPNTNLTDYSSSLLLEETLKRKGHPPYMYDPMVRPQPPPGVPSAFLIALDEEFVRRFKYPKGSVVVDPWRSLDGQELARQGARYVPIGKSGIGPWEKSG